MLNVELAKTVIVNKRSMKPDMPVENTLFFQPKTSMLFGDAKSFAGPIAEIKSHRTTLCKIFSYTLKIPEAFFHSLQGIPGFDRLALKPYINPGTGYICEI